MLTSTPCEAMDGLEILTLNMYYNHFAYSTCSLAKSNILISELYLSHSNRYTPTRPTTEYWNETKWLELITQLPMSLSTLHIIVWSKSVFQSISIGSKVMTSLLSLKLEYCSQTILDPSVSIEDNGLQIFPHLQHLSIYDDCYDVIDKPTTLHLSLLAFQGLTQLQSLDLSQTGLAKISICILKMLLSSLTHLTLSNNNIKDVNTCRSWNNASYLELLDISQNPIETVDLAPLDNVKRFAFEHFYHLNRLFEYKH